MDRENIGKEQMENILVEIVSGKETTVMKWFALGKHFHFWIPHPHPSSCFAFFFFFFFYEIKYFRVLFVLKFVNANMDDAHPDIQLFIWCCTQFVNLIYFWLNLLLVKLTCCTGNLGGLFLRGFDIVEQLCLCAKLQKCTQWTK